MKTTEMILKVKEAQDILIVNERGLVVKTDSMRDLGFVLYEISGRVNWGEKWFLCDAKNLTHYTPVVLLLAIKEQDSDEPKVDYKYTFDKIEYAIDTVHPLEFDSFGELENWSHVSEEDATQLLTKAPAEPVQIEGTDLFKQVFDALGLKYGEYHLNECNDDYAQFYHNDDGESIVNILFYSGFVQVINGDTSQPPRRLKITLVPEESNEPSTAPDQRTGYEVKAS